MNTRLIVVGLGAWLFFGLSFEAIGQDSYGSPCGWPGWGCVYPSTYCTESVPYFALHPPVYYSYRVARTYGYSPFPYPPGVMTPGSEPPHAAVVQNMYAAPAETPESQQGRQPQRIDNPVVEQPGGPGVAKGQKPATRRPQVVYPAAMGRQAG